MQENSNKPSSSPVSTHCEQASFGFQACASRKLVASFDGGSLSCDGGLPLLRQLDLSLGLSRDIASCFLDRRNPDLIVHSVQQLCAQRLLALAHGYEDLNDHASLRNDPLFQAAAGKFDTAPDRLPDGAELERPLASAPTLNRMELSSDRRDKYHKIHPQPEKLEALLLKRGVSTLRKSARELILDFDATHDPLHGKQEGRFFHGYYDCYCYLPLYVFVGDVPLWAQLRTADRDGSDGTVEALEKIVPALRRRCPKARIIVRADSGFCREQIMAWCEANHVEYVLGLARNARLLEMAEPAMLNARMRACLVGGPTREYCEFAYRTLESWSVERRVVAKAERLNDKDNQRFIVTTLGTAAETLYEKTYCGRGSMENSIKEQQLDLFGERLSTESFAANQLRLWMSVFAHYLMERLRAVALQGSELAQATAGTIRKTLLKLAARVELSVRRIWVRYSEQSAVKALYGQAWGKLMRLRQNTS